MEPTLILARALAAANPPQWINEEDRENAAKDFQVFIETVCACHGLLIARMGVLEEIEKDHNAA